MGGDESWRSCVIIYLKLLVCTSAPSVESRVLPRQWSPRRTVDIYAHGCSILIRLRTRTVPLSKYFSPR
jgi:hypothetical protein